MHVEFICIWKFKQFLTDFKNGGSQYDCFFMFVISELFCYLKAGATRVCSHFNLAFMTIGGIHEKNYKIEVDCFFKQT